MEESSRKLGPYKLVNKIGQGAFGVVWLAEKQTTVATTRFALKLPRDEDIDLDTFRQEAAIWVQASGHPNVLPLIEADFYDGQLVIVSEYVPDGSLAQWLKRNGGKAPLAEAACEIIKGVLAGLAHLHGRRIIHRDLKPENILLQRDTPRLADFGIARLLRTGSYSMNISGTLAYMAPEAFDGKRNERTDIWAVGVIFYRLLAGRLPYSQQDTTALIGAIMRYDAPLLPEESAPEVLRRILVKALQRDPNQRYASAEEMQRDLREAEHRLWLNKQGADSTFPRTAKEPKAKPPLSQPKQTETKYPPAGEAPATIPTVIRRRPQHREGQAGQSVPVPTIQVKGKSSGSILNRKWLTGAIVLLLGLFSSIGIYFWASSNAVRQPSLQTGSAKVLLKHTLSHSAAVRSMALSPDGETLASGDQDNTVRLWDVQTGALMVFEK